MREDILGALRRSLYGMALAMILSAVPAVVSADHSQTMPTPTQSPPSAQASPSGPGSPPPNAPAAVASRAAAIAPGVALGDCADIVVAMVRSFPYSTAAARPPNPAQKTCEGGRIQMQVATERHFGYRLMDPVKVTVLFSVDPSVVFDLQSLSRGTLTFNGQEFDLVSPLALPPGQQSVEVEIRRLRNGRQLVKIDLIVQSAVAPSVAPYLVFRFDLRYALGNIRDSGGNETTSPDWRVLSTPLIGLSMSPTAVPGDAFRENDDEQVQEVVPWPTYSLLFAGIVLVLLGPGVVVVRWMNRIRPGKKASREEIAWRSLDRVFADARRYGFSPGHFRAIARTIRRYFNLQSATIAELTKQLNNHPEIAEIVRVVSKCEGALYNGKTLSEEESEELMADVAKIIPRS